jgi:kynurenine formamidase
MKYIDLTHTLSPDIPTWDGTCGYKLSIETDYKDCTPPDFFRTQQIETKGGMGTHMDSPSHCIEGAETIEKLSLENLITNCVVISVKNEADENYVIMPEVVERFEKEHGTIPVNAFVIFYTGWSKHWGTPEKYRNEFKFPSVHETTAKILLERNIAGLGIDTLSADTGKQGFTVHRAILGAGKYLVENIANAGELPPVGATSFVLPIKIKDGTEAPIRIIASVK